MSDGFFGGLAEGIDTGARLGFIARQLKVQEDLKAAEEQKAKAEADKTRVEVGLAKLQRATDIFKDAPKSLKPQIYKTAIVPLANDLLGAKLDPEKYSEKTEKTISDFHDWLNLHIKGKIGLDDFLNGSALLRSQMTKEDSAQTGSILGDLPEVKTALTKPPKEITPEDALKRRTEIISQIAKFDQRSFDEAVMAQSNPAMAAAYGKTDPQAKAAFKGAVLAELRQLNQYLPPGQQLREMTRQQFEQIRAGIAAKRGSPVSDAEMYSKAIPVD